MNRIFLASPDRDESEWFSDELKEFGRIVRTIDSLDFFVPQWESVEANVVIFMESIIHSEESFLKLIKKIRLDSPETTVAFIFHRDEDDFIGILNNHGVNCVSYLDLEPGVIETRLSGITVLPYNMPSNDPTVTSVSTIQEEYSTESAITNEVEQKENDEWPSDDKSDQIAFSDQHQTSVIAETKSELSRQINSVSSKLFSIIENKKLEIQERKNTSVVDLVKPDDLDYEPVTRNINKKKRIDRFVGTAIIAVTGTEKGVGTTHTSIMIANYLSRLNYQVAIVEANESNDFVEIEASYEGFDNSNMIRSSLFNINGVKYIKNVEELNMAHHLAGNYSFIILDLGCFETTNWYDEFLRASITIVVGSGSEWKQKNVYRFFREQIHHDQSKWKVCIPFANKQTVGDIKKKLPKRKVIGIPFNGDPYEESDEIDAVLEDVLKLNQHARLNYLKKKMQAIFR